MDHYFPPIGTPYESSQGFGEASEKQVTAETLVQYRDETLFRLTLGALRRRDFGSAGELIEKNKNQTFQDMLRVLTVACGQDAQPSIDENVQEKLIQDIHDPSLQQLAMRFHAMGFVKLGEYERAVSIAEPLKAEHRFYIFDSIRRQPIAIGNDGLEKSIKRLLIDAAVEVEDTYAFNHGWPEISSLDDCLRFVTSETGDQQADLENRNYSVESVLSELFDSHYLTPDDVPTVRIQTQQVLLQTAIRIFSETFPNDLDMDDVNAIRLSADRLIERAIQNQDLPLAQKVIAAMESDEARLRFQLVILGSLTTPDESSEFNMKVGDPIAQVAEAAAKLDSEERIRFLIRLATSVGWPPAVTQWNPVIPILESNIDDDNLLLALKETSQVIGSFTPVLPPSDAAFNQLYWRLVDRQIHANGQLYKAVLQLSPSAKIHSYVHGSDDPDHRHSITSESLETTWQLLKSTHLFDDNRSVSTQDRTALAKQLISQCVALGQVERAIDFTKLILDREEQMESLATILYSLPGKPRKAFPSDYWSLYSDLPSRGGPGGIF
ncbi:MAG: hypothetical protein R3C03_21230 [Pirellulaceae bacterium]